MTTLYLGQFSAIIFDFDGVIGKTMQDNFRAWDFALSSVGIKINEQDYYCQEGLKAIDVANFFLKPAMNMELAEKLVRLKEDYYREHNQFSYYPGVTELLTKLKKNKKLALVTGASRERLNYTREAFKNPVDVFGFFDSIISATDVTHGKPHPDPYLKALAFLNMKASDCLVVENAPLGIESAKKAGLKCVGITSTLSASNLQQADWILNSIVELARFL